MEQEALRKAEKAEAEPKSILVTSVTSVVAVKDVKGATFHHISSHFNHITSPTWPFKKPTAQAKQEREEAQVEHELLSGDFGNFSLESVSFCHILLGQVSQ